MGCVGLYDVALTFAHTISWFNLSLIQHKLEQGLLALGQFQHALDELLAWMSHTEELLGEQKKAGGDPKAIEIELAKHHVRQSLTTFLLNNGNRTWRQ